MVLHCDPDIVGIGETKLKNNQTLEGCLPGYKWFGHNRMLTHVNAHSGSGGVLAFIKYSILDLFTVEKHDLTYEGIMWLKLSAKQDQCVILLCICYLPPIDSCQYVNTSEFMDTLLAQVYKYQNDGILCVTGDFNGRCGSMEDYIEGVDEVPMHDIVDTAWNQHVGKVGIGAERKSPIPWEVLNPDAGFPQGLKFWKSLGIRFLFFKALKRYGISCQGQEGSGNRKFSLAI
jgi:hypothetical protein